MNARKKCTCQKRTRCPVHRSWISRVVKPAFDKLVNKNKR